MITPELVQQLAISPAIDPALVRYPDGALQVRSSLGGGHQYSVVATRDQLYDIALAQAPGHVKAPPT